MLPEKGRKRQQQDHTAKKYRHEADIPEKRNAGAGAGGDGTARALNAQEGLSSLQGRIFSSCIKTDPPACG